MSKQIRIEDDIHAWLLDHKDSQRRNVSDVIRELIKFREQYQSD
jgi:predicted CopG family antitoxin